MGVREVRTWLISCDRCPIVHGTVAAEHRPSLPEGWSRAKVHDCGLTGYTRSDVLCALCTQREAEGSR